MSTNALAALAAFEALDLDQIKMKLMHVESGEGWSALRADLVEVEYRRFLFLMKKYPDAGASPTVDVDTFWHYHILDTMKYARDCEAVFGYFLHHYPYVGIGADAGESDHAAGGERMRAIYEAEFGAGAATDDAFAYCSSPGKQVDAVNATAADCSSPGKPAEPANTAAAYCSSPGKRLEAANTAFAYCSSPGKPRLAANAADYAYCSSPGKPVDAAYAYCSSPGKPAANAAEFAYCSSPAKPGKAVDAVHAYCSSPGKPGALAAHAYCSLPGSAANAAYAYCSIPGKPHVMRGSSARCEDLAHAA